MVKEMKINYLKYLILGATPWVRVLTNPKISYKGLKHKP